MLGRCSLSVVVCGTKRSLFAARAASSVTTTIMTCPGVIGTHDGKFHTDEVFACYMLRQLSEFKDASIVRTRNPDILKTCKVVVDVGGVYDPSSLRFDHHQRSFTESLRTLTGLDFDTKLSSAGLVYSHFGKQLIATLLGLKPSDHQVIDVLFHRMYENFVHAVDAIDNGVSQYPGPALFRQSSTLNSRVNMLNPAWNDATSIPDVQFAKAMQIVGDDFVDQLKYNYNSWLPARQFVETAVDGRFNVHPSGRIIVLENGSCPWKEHFLTIEKERKLEPGHVLYCLYPDSGRAWRVQAIPVNAQDVFENRCPLPKDWQGIRDQELTKLTGIPGCIFVHGTGFIGGNATYEGALAMAERSLIINGKWNP